MGGGSEAEVEGIAQITVRLPEDLRRQVDRLAKQARRTRNGQVVWMLEQHLRGLDESQGEGAVQ